MVIDNTALAQWGLVPALGVLFGITITYAYKIYYKKIIENEIKVINKVRDDVTDKVNNFQQVTNKNQQGEQEFGNQISRIEKFKEMINESKQLFKRDIINSAIITIVSGISSVIWIDKRETIFVVGMIVLGYHLLMFNSLRVNYDKLERFLNGEDPKKILGE